MDDGIHTSSLEGEWSPWKEIPGGGKTLSAPAIAHSNPDAIPFIEVSSDLLNIVVRGTDDGLHFKRFDNSSWSAWNLIPGGGKTKSAPALIEFDGDLHLFVRGYDNGIHLKKFDGSSWSAWTEVPGGGKTPSAPAVVEYDGDLYLFVRGMDDNIHYKILD